MGLILVAILAACGGGSTPTPTPTPPPNQGWWRDRVVYEIFVRSFADSDGDGVGDLKGLTAHLDDLNDGNPATTTDLGVDAIWLMPIFPSPSYHGYDVSDYRSVNPQYGTMADFDAFVAAAHQRGIKVILDMVLNHSS
jgi:alpha-amylase